MPGGRDAPERTFLIAVLSLAFAVTAVALLGEPILRGLTGGATYGGGAICSNECDPDTYTPTCDSSGALRVCGQFDIDICNEEGLLFCASGTACEAPLGKRFNWSTVIAPGTAPGSTLVTLAESELVFPDEPAAANVLSIQYTITTLPADADPNTFKIYADLNGDGDFADSGERRPTSYHGLGVFSTNAAFLPKAAPISIILASTDRDGDGQPNDLDECEDGCPDIPAERYTMIGFADPATGIGAGHDSGTRGSARITFMITPCRCFESWICDSWGPCIDGVQERTCEDTQACGTRLYEPVTEQPCAAGTPPPARPPLPPPVVVVGAPPLSYTGPTLDPPPLPVHLTALARSLGLGQSNLGFTCGYQLGGLEQAVTLWTVPGAPPLPTGYHVIERFTADCDGQGLDLTLSIPDNYRDVQVFRCRDGACDESRTITNTTVTAHPTCAGIPLEQLRREEVVLQSQQPEAFEPLTGTGQVITPAMPAVETGGYRLEFTGSVNLAVRLASPSAALPLPPNPAYVLVGSPLQVEVDNPPPGPLAAVLRIPLPAGPVEPGSLVIHALVDGVWEPLASTQYAGTLTVAIDDLRAYLQDGRAVFAAIGIACFACTEGRLELVNDPGVRDAVVLVHGFGSTPRTWQPFIDELVLGRQPLQVWVYGYPFTQPTDTSARELADQLELQAARYDRLFLVGHSLGGIVMEKALALAYADRGAYSFLRKARAAISVGAPHDGVPVFGVLETFAGFLKAAPTAYAAFNPETAAAQELKAPFATPRVPGVRYAVVAGVRGLTATTAFFTETNDGITTVHGAQRIGDAALADTCTDYFPLQLTHTELNDGGDARTVIGRLVTSDLAAEHPDLALVGYSQYARFQVAACDSADTYVVAGIPIDERAAAQPLGCGCGNGVCGVDETVESCPTDCAASPIRAILCTGLTALAGLAVAALAVFALVHLHAVVTRRYERDTAHRRGQIAVIIGGIIAYTARAIICGHLPLLALALVALAALALIIDAVRQKTHRHTHIV